MNEGHLTYLASPEWRDYLVDFLIPWVLEGRSLGEDLLEVGPSLASELARRLAGTNVTVLEADASELALDEASFDSAACFTMLHHVPTAEQQDRVLSEIYRVLRPGGVLVGTDSLEHPVIREVHVDDTFNPMTPADLRVRLAAAGFAHVDIEADEYKMRFAATKG